MITPLMQRPSRALKGFTSSRKFGDENTNTYPDSRSYPLYLCLRGTGVRRAEPGDKSWHRAHGGEAL